VGPGYFTHRDTAKHFGGASVDRVGSLTYARFNATLSFHVLDVAAEHMWSH
jgi:hypothetical protein